MAVSLPGSTASLASEYAATNISFNRSMVPDSNGHLVASFSASVSYARTDYVVDGNGNKLNIVQRTVFPNATPGPDPYQGNIFLQGASLAPLAATVPAVDLLDAIANMADSLIHDDLISRKILSA